MRINYTRSWISRIRHPSFRMKLVLSYVALITLPLAAMGYKYYAASRDFVSEFAMQNIHSIVKQNNELIDAELSRVEDSSLAMIADQDLFREYLNVERSDEYSIVTMEKSVKKVESKYFSEYKNIYSVHLITSFANFGSSGIIPYARFNRTALYREAIDSDGGLRWIPTFNFASMTGTEYLKSVPVDYSRLFAAVRLLKLFRINNGEVTELEGKAELPVLVVTYKPELYGDLFKSSLPVGGASFFVVSPQGDIVASSDERNIATREKPVWLDDIIRKRSGSVTVTENGKPMIVCFDTSAVTGWISGIVLSPGELMNSFLPRIQSYTYYFAMALLVVSLLFAFFFAESITKPIQRLLQAIKKAGEGDFETKIPVGGVSEMGYLISKFNQMNARINMLIEENYKVALREKEAEITALNIQLNPHFLYNTLNIINWMALENKQKEISRMLISLSSMLQYTSQNQHDIGDFRADLEWLQNYLFIIDNRFEGKFTVTFDIDPELYAYKVPKLFLQPFVENAIIHGFSRIHSGGEIRIRGRIEGDRRIFSVEDNGKGFGSTEMSGIVSHVHRAATDRKKITVSRERESTGIRNVDKRIKLIYGGEYGVTLESQEGRGTTVTIALPKQNP